MPDKIEDQPVDAQTLLEQLLAKRFSNLYGAIRPDAKLGVYSLSCRMKGRREWLIVMRRYEPSTSEPQVLFASGESMAGALLELNRAIARGRWSKDRFGVQ